MPTIILAYHGVAFGAAAATNLHSVGASRFREQIAYLGESKCRVLPWGAMSAATLDADRLAVGLTFDDANHSDITCAETLRSLGYSALFFIPTACLGTRDRLARSDIADLRRHGMGIGSHSHNHVQLARIDDARLNDELRRSKEILEDIVGNPVEHLSFPGGSYNRRVLAAARRSGYRYLYTSDWGRNEARETASGVLRRIPIIADFDLDAFRDIVEMRGYGLRMAKFYVKELAKRTLGEQKFVQLRKALLKNRSTTEL